MSTNRSKTLTGPFTLKLYDGETPPVSQCTLENLLPDKVTFEFLRDVISDELDDGSQESFPGGGKLKIEVNFSEVDENDLNDAGPGIYNDWVASTAYVQGAVVVPTTKNGHKYVCTVAGTSHSSEPSWPTTSGGTVSDGTVTWAEAGVVRAIESTSIVSVELHFPNKNKKVTIAVDVLDGGDLIYSEIVAGRGKITILKSLPIGRHIDDIITIAAIT